MGTLKVARKIPFLVSITYNLKETVIEQVFKFQVTNKKHLNYAYDHRFCLKRKLDKLIDEELLSSTSFIGRNDEEDKIVLTYRNDFGKFDNSSKIVNCEFYLPPFNGCLYCENCTEEGNFLYCKLKKKHYDSKGIKSCPVFKSVDKVLT
jgi:hypothetical protein